MILIFQTSVLPGYLTGLSIYTFESKKQVEDDEHKDFTAQNV